MPLDLDGWGGRCICWGGACAFLRDQRSFEDELCVSEAPRPPPDTGIPPCAEERAVTAPAHFRRELRRELASRGRMQPPLYEGRAARVAAQQRGGVDAAAEGLNGLP